KNLTSWGECLMTRLRYHHMLAGTALAVILAAIPLGSLALDRSKTAPGSGSPAEHTSTEASSPALAATIESVTTTEPAATTETAPTTAINSEPAAAAESTVAAERAVVDPLASLDPADRPIAEKIRDLFAASSDRIFANKKERAAAEAFYQSRNYAPLWVDKGLENARATSAIARLKNADADGLEASDYKTPNFAGLTGDALAEADLKLTQAVLTYARHAQAGRFTYTRVSRNIELPQAAPEPADVLSMMTAATDAGKALDTLSPQNEGYQKLKTMLAELRGSSV